MGLWDTFKDAVGFVPVVGDALELGIGVAEGIVGGGQKFTSCPGQAELAARIERALGNAPASARQAYLANFQDGAGNPSRMAFHVLGGSDCQVSNPAHPVVTSTHAFLAAWENPSGSAPYLEERDAVAPSPLSVFSGPSGAPLGIPAWLWIIAAGLAVLAAVRLFGD